MPFICALLFQAQPSPAHVAAAKLRGLPPFACVFVWSPGVGQIVPAILAQVWVANWSRAVYSCHTALVVGRDGGIVWSGASPLPSGGFEVDLGREVQRPGLASPGSLYKLKIKVVVNMATLIWPDWLCAHAWPGNEEALIFTFGSCLACHCALISLQGLRSCRRIADYTGRAFDLW